MAVHRVGMLFWACVFHALVSCSPAGVAGDIPDDVVYTDLHKMVRLGDSVVLKCQFRGTPSAVYWKKGDDPRTAPNLVSWIPGDPVTGLCEGERPCQIMEMNENFSLIIKEISIAEEGRYICRVSSYKGMLIQNFTDIRVFCPPKEPFPVIDECVESESFTSDSTQPCSVLTNDSIVSISCTVTNYYSDLDLFFLHGSQKIRDAATNVLTNDDGTMNKSVYIKASASETHYVCIASSIPGSNDQRAATVMVKSLRPTGTPSTITTPQRLHTSYSATGVKIDMSNDNRAAKIAVPIIVIMVFIVGIGLAMCFIFRRRRRHTGSGGATKIGTDEEVPMLRKKSKLSGDTSIPSRHLQQDEPMSPEMKKFQKELKDIYQQEYTMIKTSPLDPESEKRLQQIYVKLELILDDEKKGEERKKPLEYDELFELIRTETGSGSKTRFAFIGEAGVGKSTLLARIAFDWATGKCLQEIALLFLHPLREVMETKYFGDIALNYVSDDIELEGEEIDGFIRYHQRKVLFLFDGLDESKLHLKSPDRDNATASILRGDRFRKSAVIVSTRPSHVEQIKTNENIHKQYTCVQVEGFTRENMAEYVRRFFEDDTDSSSSLIECMNTNEVIAEHMAPYPIFCSMLCHLWKSESKREKMQKMRTYSQIMKEMVFSLQEQYSSKYSDYENNVKRTDKAMAKIGSVAFNGLLKNQLVFKKDKITSIIEDATIACNLGILSKERKLLPREIRQREKKQFADEFRFPHKLMQEFMAGQYLSSLYNTNLSEFQRVLREKLLRSKEDFRYVLYFTAAHGGAVGRSVIESLCHVHQNDLEFIMEVVFECQDMEAIDHVVNLVRRERGLNLSRYRMSHHAVCGYLLTLERCGQRAIRTNSIPRNLDSPSNASATSSSPYTAATGLFTLEKLRELVLAADLDDDFYTGMATYASESQIERWSHYEANLGPSVSQQYARGLFSMPELTSLNLYGMELDDEFFSAMVQVSPRSKIESWSHFYSTLGSPASQQYATGLFSMPELTSLNLDVVKLDDEFYSAMVQVSPRSKIEDWSHTAGSLGPSASQQYARGLFSMPELTSLNLDGVELDDEFFSAMVQVSPQSKIEKLTMKRLTLTRHSLHTFLSLPCLQSLDMGEGIACTETDNADTSVESSHGSSVDKLSVYNESVVELWKLGLHTSCPRVNTLIIKSPIDDVLSSDIVSMACSPFPHLTVLHIKRGPVDSVSFCDAVMSSCLRLNTLTFTWVKLSNEMATEIIQSMKTHPQLKTLKFDDCLTNEALDPLIAEINKEGSLTVIATRCGI